MPEQDEETVPMSVWIPKTSSLLERFDAEYDTHERSAHVREGMELLLAIDDVLETAGYDFARPQEKRAFVRQAVINEIQREPDE